MMQTLCRCYDVVVIGAGPAGLAAAIAANDNRAKTLVVEREKRPGGILKQCIHDGFGIITFNEKLTGPEYVERYIHEVKKREIEVLTLTYVTNIISQEGGFKVYLVNKEIGVFEVFTKTIVLANGCRERTSKQILITGTRPAGVYTAGTAQYFVNILGYLPCKKCVILGSGDIGLIMARRLTLEGAVVIGVYEAKSAPSGLARNIVQCLEDFDIPLHLSHTVTRVFGEDRVEAVEITQVDEATNPIEGTAKLVQCDGIILSVGLIPENELAEELEVKIDPSTRGPIVDENFMTSTFGIFSCGNALHVNDLVDYVTESGSLAGKSAAECCLGLAIESNFKQLEQANIVVAKNDFLYVVPQKLNCMSKGKTTIYFRSKNEEENVKVQLLYKDNTIFSEKYVKLKPPEMERLVLDFSSLVPEIEAASEFKLVINRN